MANTELRIKDLCKKNGITQAVLAERLGILPVSFSQAVSRNKFNMDRLSDIADALGVEIWQLFASAEEARGEVCPHCGMPIKIKIEKGE